MEQPDIPEESGPHGGGTKQPLGDGPGAPVYFPVSPLKLVVMSICTFGLYELFWYYKNWKLVSRREGRNISSVIRAIFAIFFCLSLFKRFQRTAESIHLGRSISPALLAAGWITTSLLSILPDPLWITSLLSVVFLVPVQIIANDINKSLSPECKINKKFTPLNIVGIVICGLFVMLSLVGIFLPEGGVRASNNMEPYALDYISKHNLVNNNESIVVYYDASVSLNSTECAILTNKYLIYHRNDINTVMNNKDITQVSIQDLGIRGDGITIIGKDNATIYIEIAALNNSMLFYEALQRVVGKNNAS